MIQSKYHHTTSFSRFIEPAIWCVLLIIVFFMQTGGTSLCIFSRIGISWCPGCGLGHAMTHAMHFNFAESFQNHWFGIPAILIIFHRIIQSSRNALYATTK